MHMGVLDRVIARRLLALLLSAVAALAVWTRIQYIDLYGGRTDAYNAWADQHYFGGLSVFYLSTSDELARGHSYTVLHHPPGYSYLLAALKVAGARSVGAIRIAQSAFDAAIVFVVYGLARALGVRPAGAVAAAGVYAVWPLFAIGATWPLAESLSPVLMAAILALLVGVRRSGRGVVTAGACGFIIGLSALVRPDFLLLIVPATVWILLPGVDRVREKTAALLLAFAVPLFAWGIHNRVTNGVWVFGSTSSGLNFWEGLGEAPNSYGYVLDDSAANHVLMARQLTWGSVDADRYFRREYAHAWRNPPVFVLRVIAARIPRILFESERLQPLFFGRARQLIDVAGLIFVIAAVWIHRRERAVWLLLVLPPLYAVGSIGLVHYEPRYVRYVQLSYILAAVVLAEAAWRRLSRYSMRLTAATVWTLAAAAAAYTVRELHAQLGREHV